MPPKQAKTRGISEIIGSDFDDDGYLMYRIVFNDGASGDTMWIRYRDLTDASEQIAAFEAKCKKARRKDRAAAKKLKASQSAEEEKEKKDKDKKNKDKKGETETGSSSSDIPSN